MKNWFFIGCLNTRFVELSITFKGTLNLGNIGQFRNVDGDFERWFGIL